MSVAYCRRPRIGFAKNTEHNVALLRDLAQFKRNLGNLPVLIGASRKRFLGELAGEADAAPETRRRPAPASPACRTPTSSASTTSARPSRL